MKVFDAISSFLDQQIPFVCYVKPNETVWNLLQQNDTEIVDFSGQAGFVFVTFDTAHQVVIPFEGNFFSQGILETIQKTPISTFPNTENNQKVAFENLVSKGITAIQNGTFEKVVLSRKIVLETQLSIIETFQNMILSYPTAFRYLFFHPKIGLWMGATPEQLVKINQNHFETVALAGTQLFAENIHWATKEIEEQQFVVDFIVSNLKNKVENLYVSEQKTVQAGNLAHLKSIISGTLSPEFDALDLVKTIHPTPAICGLPKEAAKDFIVRNENYNRKYYSGFLGEFNSENTTDLFVNLRCLEIDEKKVNIYVGCGITKDSHPEKEYFETENKSMTMRNVLVVSVQ